MKRIIAMMLGLVMALSIAVPAFAADEPAARPEQAAEDYALTFMNSVDGKTRQVKATTPMYDYTGSTVTGWYITFTADGSPAGYVILGLFNTGGPIMEFATEGEGIVPATYATGNTLVFEGGGRMYVKTHDENFYNILFQNTVDMETIQATASSPVMAVDGYFENKFIDGAYLTLTSTKTITALNSPTQYPTQPEYNKADNCGPTTAANILLYWARDRNKQSIKNLIPATATTTLAKGKILHDLCYTAMNTSSNGTQVADTIKGYTTLLGQPNTSTSNWKYYTIEGGRPTTTTWARYKQLLDQNVPIQLFLAQTQVIGNITAGDKHFSFCTGYATASDGTYYLQVFSGNHKVHAYVQFLNYIPYLQAYGIEVLK